MSRMFIENLWLSYMSYYFYIAAHEKTEMFWVNLLNSVTA